MIWPWLIAAAALAGWWRNPYGAAGFILAVLCVRGLWVIFDTFPQLAVMFIYSSIAAVWVFYVDRVAAVFLALVALVVWLHIQGFISGVDKSFVGEGLILLGALICAISGPSGGIFYKPRTGWHSLAGRGHYSSTVGSTCLVAQDRKDLAENT